MKLIILAAGKGTRLYPLTRNRPKLLIELDNGVTLIERQMEMLSQSQVIDEVVYVVGYLGARVEKKVVELSKKFNLNARCIFNPFFDVSNNLASLWLARAELQENCLITNGDNLFAPAVFKTLDKVKDDGIHITINFKNDYDDDDMKVIIDDLRMLQAIGKDLPVEETNAESVGLVKVLGKEYVNSFVDILEELIRNEEKINSFWLESFNHLHSTGLPISTVEIDGDGQWQEVDFHLDVKLAREMIIGQTNKFLEE